MSSSKENVRVLVFGDVEGHFDSFFLKLSQLNSKSGPFDVVLCVGDFFGNDEVKNEQFLESYWKSPVPIYILGANKPKHVQFYDVLSELTENVTYLGRQGLLTTANGLSIAYLSGVESSEGCGSYSFNEDSYKQLIIPIASTADFDGVDILMTSQWPKDIIRFDSSRATLKEETITQSAIISRVASVLRPRYHFAGLNDIFYERQPYRNHKVLAEQSKQVTRFVALGKLTSAKKQRAIYAFNIVPMSRLSRQKLIEQPPDTTEFPFGNVLNALRDTVVSKTAGETSQQYFYDLSTASEETSNKKKRQLPERGGRGNGNEKKQKAQLPPAACWFCLSSPEVEKHLVVSIGENSYLAMAKGPLVPEHILILPIGHYQSMISAPEDVREEIEMYKDALRKYFASKGRNVTFFERNFKSQHLQVQVVPLPKKLTAAIVKEAFQNSADAFSINLSEFTTSNELLEAVEEGVPYFCVEYDVGKSLFCRVNVNPRLQLHMAYFISYGSLGSLQPWEHN